MKKMIAVEVFFRDRRLKEQVFDQDAVTIGRDPASDVHLDNVGVSRLHATLIRLDSGVQIADAGSSNGSLVNLMRVTEATLSPTDEVQIGKFVLRVSQREPRGVASVRGGARQLPESETLRVAEDRPRSAPAEWSDEPSLSPKRGKGVSPLVIGALFVAGIAVGLVISNL